MKQNESKNKKPENPTEEPSTKKKIDKNSDHSSSKQTEVEKSDYDNNGRPNSPFN